MTQSTATPSQLPAAVVSPQLRAADGFASRLQQAIGAVAPQPGTAAGGGIGASLATADVAPSVAVQASSTGALTLGAMLRAGAPTSTGIATAYGLGGSAFTIDQGAALAASIAQTAVPAVEVAHAHDAATHGSGPLAGRATVAPVEGRQTSPFGDRVHPITGAHRAHHGLDIAAPTGTPVRSITDGTVVSAGDRGGYGLTVEVDHGDGVTSRYAHMSALDVRVGDRVPVGGSVGAVGSTGNSTGPHLHVEVRVHGEPVDPDGIW